MVNDLNLKSKIIGRDRELSRLKYYFNMATEGNGNTVLIAGEAGIGKTTLVNEFINYVKEKNVVVLRGECLHESLSFYFPFSEAIKSYFKITNEDNNIIRRKKILNALKKSAPSLLRLFPFIGDVLSAISSFYVHYDELNPKLDRYRIFETFSQLFISISKKKVVLLFIEDLQRADPSSLYLLYYLGRSTMQSKVFIIGTYRPEDVPPLWEGKTHPLVEIMQLMNRDGFLSEIELKRLSKNDCFNIMVSCLGETDFSGEFINRIYKETEGNPLFLKEVLRMLIEEETIIEKWHVWKTTTNLDTIHIPSKVYDVIIRRINKLQPEYRNILDCASIVGEEFSSNIIGKVLQIDKMHLLHHLTNIRRMHRLIYMINTVYRFDHVKIREVLYRELDELNIELKREYHRLIGDGIEEENKDNIEQVVTDLAYHYYQAKDVKKAILYLFKAGKKAKSIYATNEAIKFYRWTLELLSEKEDLKKRLETLKNLGDIYTLIGENSNAIENFSKAMRLTEDTMSIAELYRKIGDVYEKKGEFNTALEYYNDGLKIIGEGSKDPIVGRIYNSIGWTYMRKGEYEKAIKFYSNALEIAKIDEDKKGIVNIYLNIGTICWRKGDYASALDFLSKELREEKIRADKYTMAMFYNAIGLVYWNKGKLNHALENHNRSLQIRKKIGDIQGIAMSYNNIGRVYYTKGELDKAIRLHLKGLELLRRIQDTWGMALSYNNIGEIYLDKGELSLAFNCFQKSLEIAKKIDDSRGISMVYNNIGDIYSKKGELGKALKYYSKSIRICKLITEKWTLIQNYCGMSELYGKMGNYNKALEYGQNALFLSKEIGARDQEAWSYRVIGVAYICKNIWDSAGENFRQSIKISKELRQKIELGRTYYEYGLLWKKKGKMKNAQKFFKIALKYFESEGMKIEIKKVKEELSNLRVHNSKTLRPTNRR